MAPADPLSQGIGKLALLYPFSFVGLVLAFFFYFNGSALFPEFGELGLDKWILAYIVMQVAALAVARRQLSQLPLPLSIAWFAGGFVVAYTLFTVMFMGGGIEQPFPVTGTVITIVAFQYVVATSEEVFFRGILVRDVEGSPAVTWISIIVSALAFAGFHIAAYTQIAGFSITSFFWPFAFGLMMGILFWKTKSISVVIGIHWAYNLAILGVSPF